MYPESLLYDAINAAIHSCACAGLKHDSNRDKPRDTRLVLHELPIRRHERFATGIEKTNDVVGGEMQ